MADLVYGYFKVFVMSSVMPDMSSAGTTIKCMLTTSSYTANQDTHDYKDHVTNEVTGTGYTAGGATLANKTVTYDGTNHRGVFDADDVTWSSSTITARYAVLYQSTGTDGTSPLICMIDFGSDKSSSNGNFTIQWNSSGILTIS